MNFVEQKEVNNSDTEGIKIKRPRFQNDDILIADFTKIITSSIIPSTVKQKITKISEVLIEGAMHHRLNIKAMISHPSNIRQHDRDGKMVAVCTGVVHDETSLANLSIFEELTNKLVNGKSCLSKIVEVKFLDV